MKTHCLESNTARAYHQRAFLVAILGAVQDLRLGLAMGNRRVSHLAGERILYCETIPISDPSTINEPDATLPKTQCSNSRLIQDLRERPSQNPRDPQRTATIRTIRINEQRPQPLQHHTNHKTEKKKHTKTHTREDMEGQGTTISSHTHIEPHNGRTLQDLSLYYDNLLAFVNLSLLNWRVLAIVLSILHLLHHI